MIIKVKAESVSMPCDQYAEILNIKTRGQAVDFEIKLLGTIYMVKPWDVVGVKLTEDFTLKIKWDGHSFSETRCLSCV